MTKHFKGQHATAFILALVAMLLVVPRVGVSSSAPASILPNGWILRPPSGAMKQTGTMPQGATASPDGSVLAVVESGFNPPALTLYATRDLHLIRRIRLSGAFGRPVWTPGGILVAGANADAVFEVDPRSGAVRSFPVGKNTWPASVAVCGRFVAVATNKDGSVRIGSLDHLGRARPTYVGAQPGNLTFSAHGRRLFVAIRSASYVAVVNVRTGAVQHLQTELHPTDVLLRRGLLYVAQSDADTVGVYDAATLKLVREIFVGALPPFIGSSPNALATQGGSIFVSLGAANEVAVLRGGKVAERLPAGWYPTDAIPVKNRLFILDGKGEGTKPNPGFDVMSSGFHDYVAAIEYGSIRVISLTGSSPPTNPQGQRGFRLRPPVGTIVRRGGPITHVFFILKENRTYDQILGDIGAGNSDAKLAWFGQRVTPNQHALARRFGIFDNFYASGEVSDTGHNWADTAIANDYVERYWPSAYGGRNDDDHVLDGAGAHVPRNGYMWDAARRAHVSFRDYGEMAQLPGDGDHTITAPSLARHYDPKYVSWNLGYSDLDREKEWQREFERFVKSGTVPQLEYMWLPNDHTAGSRAGQLTPAAMIAQNDYATGLIVQAISHSSIWPSSVIFITEDDAQDGADHVSDQRTTLYVVSPYARGGVIHEHYSTVGVLRTIELFLGIEPLTTYDATAVPLYAAFTSVPKLAPFDALAPEIDLTARNMKTAYGEHRSAIANFKKPDAVPAKLLTDILAHNRSFTLASGRNSRSL
jgi:DNA-binding beta-propeller fold protein YncE